MKRMSIDDFYALLLARIEAWVAAEKRERAKGTPGFVEPEFVHRTAEDWMNEFEAYEKYVDLQELQQIAGDSGDEEADPL